MSRLLSFLSCLVCILAAPDADAAVPRIPPAKAAAWVIPGAQVVLYADVGASLDLLDDMLDLAVTLPVLRTLPGVQAEVQELRASLTRELDDARAASGLDLRDKVGMALLCFAVDNAGMINLLLVVRGDYAAPGAIDKLLSSGRVEDYKGKKVAAMPDVELAGGGLMYADKQFLVLGSTHNVRQFIDRKPFGKSAVSAQVAGMPTGTLLGGVTDVESLMGIREVRG
ncbi:MAG: hypothetical protein FJ109_22120, partial [Deltaproteobacteria bacterium]|nr:hypothetical protein [Deltaproteobacteria bacterium]